MGGTPKAEVTGFYRGKKGDGQARFFCRQSTSTGFENGGGGKKEKKELFVQLRETAKERKAFAFWWA